jgi:hypothetical protein
VFPIETVPVPVVAIVTLDAPALAKSVAPVEVRVVNLPVPTVPAPIETNVAAPAPVTPQLASCKTKSDPEPAPTVIVPPVEFPIVIVWALAAVPIRIEPLEDVDVPTSRTIFPAVDVVPAALPVLIVTPPELVDAPDWFALFKVRAVDAVVAPD